MMSVDKEHAWALRCCCADAAA